MMKTRIVEMVRRRYFTEEERYTSKYKIFDKYLSSGYLIRNLKDLKYKHSQIIEKNNRKNTKRI